MHKTRGVFYVIFGTMLWGISGAVAQYFFSNTNMQPFWLLAIRLVLAGLMLLIWYAFSNGFTATFAIWKSKNFAIQMIAFSFLGVVPSELSYFMAIKYGNAATATVLQFLGPLFIIIYLCLANWQLPRRIDAFSIFIALLGTFLLVTDGRINSLSLSIPAFIWGVLAGVSQATYTLIPRNLMKKFDSRLVVGWAMLIGSLPFLGNLSPSNSPKITLEIVIGLAYIIIAGTMLAYLLYLKSIKYISPAATGMLSAFDPLTATVLSIGLLGTPVTLIQIFGGTLILLTAFLQALPNKFLINKYKKNDSNS